MKKSLRDTRPTVISLFAGALGLDLGLEEAGYRIAVAVECDPTAARTIRANRPDIALIEKPIETVTTDEILAAGKLKKGEVDLVTGGPSCQAFSTAGKRQSLSDPGGGLFVHFIRVVEEAQPKFFIMENVRGMLSAAIKHRTLEERGPGYPILTDEEQLGSAFAKILKEVSTLKYSIVFDVVNAANYGVPQIRERVVFIGSRDGKRVQIPTATHSLTLQKGKKKWLTLRRALKDLDDPSPEYAPFEESRLKYLRLIGAGGNWKDLPKKVQEAAIGKAYLSWGGRSGFLRRLAWDRPAPALTTNPAGKATCLCHPDHDRPLSVAEYKRIQQFPDEWELLGSTTRKYRQIGNAVPVGLGAVLGEAIRKANRTRLNPKLVGKIRCENSELIKSLTNCPKTQLNPEWMRKKATPESLFKWTRGLRSGRWELFSKYVIDCSDAKAA